MKGQGNGFAIKSAHADAAEEENDYRRLFMHSLMWTHAHPPHYFELAAKGQTPDFLYIGCSDSRVCPNEMTGLTMGELFVHRNIANVVSPTNVSTNAVINYAIKGLNVRHIIVCGHFNCGGVAHAFGPVGDGVLDAWIWQIRDVYRKHKAAVDACKDIKEKRKELVRCNVREQCRNVLKNPIVQEEAHRLRIHGVVFDIENGRLIDLKLDYQALLDDVVGVKSVSSSH